jgi:hypothetical protein
MFFRNDMILMLLLNVFMQEYDFKGVVIGTWEVAEPAVWSEAGSSEVARSLIAAAPR